VIYLELLIGFLKVGFFSFGGGFASIPVVRDVVLHYGWMSEDMLTYMIAVSQSTPGPIMVNLATYVGSSKAGVLGALIATIVVVLPAFIIMIIAAMIMERVVDNPYVKAVLHGLIPCIAGIITATGIYSFINVCLVKEPKLMPDYRMTILTVAIVFIYYASRKFKKKGISPIGIIVLSAIAGVIVLR